MMLAVVASCAMFASCGGNKEDKKDADQTEQNQNVPEVNNEEGNPAEINCTCGEECAAANCEGCENTECKQVVEDENTNADENTEKTEE